jgi:hypothetical protein
MSLHILAVTALPVMKQQTLCSQGNTVYLNSGGLNTSTSTAGSNSSGYNFRLTHCSAVSVFPHPYRNQVSFSRTASVQQKRVLSSQCQSYMRGATRYELGTFANKYYTCCQLKYFLCKSQLEMQTVILSQYNFMGLYSSL